MRPKPKKGTKGNWVRKLFAKRKTRQSQNQDGYANLLETTRSKMVERAKKLKDQDQTISKQKEIAEKES
jgi:hypothetical protein